MAPWDRVYRGFCEYQLNGHPEWGNTLSSLVITAIACYGLYANRIHQDAYRLVYALYAVTGIGSAMYHATGYAFWGQLDTIPMLISSWIIVYKAWEVVLRRLLATTAEVVYDKIADTFAIIVAVLLCFSLAFRGVSGDPYGIDLSFNALFAAPQLVTATALVAAYFAFRGVDAPTRPTFRYLFAGVVVVVFSALLWLATEPYCADHPWLAYLFAHSVWHIGVIWGAHLAIQAVMMLDLLHRKENPEYGGCMLLPITRRRH